MTCPKSAPESLRRWEILGVALLHVQAGILTEIRGASLDLEQLVAVTWLAAGYFSGRVEENFDHVVFPTDVPRPGVVILGGECAYVFSPLDEAYATLVVLERERALGRGLVQAARWASKLASSVDHAGTRGPRLRNDALCAL